MSRERRRSPAPARLVELPVGATEDRLVGALDIERALTEGVKAYEPGLLAAAHRGVLYVDEVNLLHDHLVDLLLDAAALGTCYVERDGVSVRHAARFLLVGTMNPEEGELRPQLLDRFGLTVEAAAPRDAGACAARWYGGGWPTTPTRPGSPRGWRRRRGRRWPARIVAAQALLPGVVLPDAALRQIAVGVRGVRRGRAARGPGHRAGGDRARGVGGPARGHRRGRAGRRAAGAAAPAQAAAVRRAAARRGRTGQGAGRGR